ncbi:MAG: restriction endonuclease subunit S [Pseudomonadota bacterium]
MKAGWEVKPLEEVADHCLGKMLDKHKNKGTPRPYLRNINVRWFDFDLTDVKEMRFEDHECHRYTVQRDDVVICEGGYPGRCAIWNEDEPIFFQKALHRVRCGSELRPEWLAYYLSHMDASGDLTSHFSGTGIQHFTGKALGTLPIPLPPLDEQRRIVAVLDAAHEALARARANVEANLADASDVVQAELTELFDRKLESCETRTFDEIKSETLIGLLRNKAEQSADRAYDYLKMQHIANDNRYKGGIADRIDCTPEELRKFRLAKGDFLFNTRNSRELVGKSCVLETEPDNPTVHNNNVMRVRFNPEIIPHYIALAFRSQRIRREIEPLKSGTTSVVAIYYNALRNIRIPIPDQRSQSFIVERFERLDDLGQRLSSRYNRQLTDLTDLRQSLLAAAFRGELT